MHLVLQLHSEQEQRSLSPVQPFCFPDQPRSKSSQLLQQAYLTCLPLYLGTIAMGNLVWHEYGRYVALTASACEYSPSLATRHRYSLRGRLTYSPWCSPARRCLGGFLWNFLQEIHLRLCQWNRSCPRRCSVSVVLFVWQPPRPSVSIPDRRSLIQSASGASRTTLHACRPLRVARSNFGSPSFSAPGTGVGDTRAPAGCRSHPSCN